MNNLKLFVFLDKSICFYPTVLEHAKLLPYLNVQKPIVRFKKDLTKVNAQSLQIWSRKTPGRRCFYEFRALMTRIKVS